MNPGGPTAGRENHVHFEQSFQDMMTADSDNIGPADQGLSALVALLRFHGVGADPEQIRHRFGTQPIGIPEMLRCAKELGLKAQSRVTTWERLVNTPLPGIVATSHLPLRTPTRAFTMV